MGRAVGDRGCFRSGHAGQAFEAEARHEWAGGGPVRIVVSEAEMDGVRLARR